MGEPSSPGIPEPAVSHPDHSCLLVLKLVDGGLSCEGDAATRRIFVIFLHIKERAHQSSHPIGSKFEQIAGRVALVWLTGDAFHMCCNIMS